MPQQRNADAGLMDRRIQTIISGLRGYLEGLKGMGILALPVSSQAGKSPKVLGLEEIRSEMGDCRRCKLHRSRRTLVFGEGDKRAKLMIVGEGPGYDEDVAGKPFVGKAGQLLTRILEAIHLRRDEVYIANIIKCRPPQNRNPEPDEIQNCSPFLLKQIQAVDPRIICALGTFAAQTLLQTDSKISVLRGRFYNLKGIRVMPTYHPAYLLRNPERKKDVWQDMKKIAEALKE